MAALKLAELATVACLLLCLPTAVRANYVANQEEHSIGKYDFDKRCGDYTLGEHWSTEDGKASSKFYAEALRRRWVYGVKDRLAGGYIPEKNKVRSFAQLVLKESPKSYRPICGAVIMGKHLALTAVNCVIDGKVPYKPDKLVVTPGSDKWNAETRTEQTREVKKICFVLERFDIAILLLDGPPMSFTGRYGTVPACLADSQYTEGVLTGMGETEKNAPTRHLRYFPVKFERCLYGIPEDSFTTCMRFSEPWQVGGICDGDGGSPVLAFYKGEELLTTAQMLIGITIKPKHAPVCVPREAHTFQVRVVDIWKLVRSGKLKEMMKICTKELA